MTDTNEDKDCNTAEQAPDNSINCQLGFSSWPMECDKKWEVEKTVENHLKMMNDESIQGGSISISTACAYNLAD